ncbi:MAG: CHAT domain-containing protein [Planctomycetota bacterium]|jgi:CHAT domain-containing protein
MPGTEPKVTLQVLWQSADAIRVTPFKEGSALESTVKASRTCPFHSTLVAGRAREVLALLARANSGAKGLAQPLIEAGKAIYVDLLPAFLKEKLEEASAPNLLLHLDRQLLGIPWELLHDGDRFLGRRFRIGRLVSLEQTAHRPLERTMEPPLSALIVADPAGDLPAARQEGEALATMLEDSPLFGPVTLLCGHVTLRTLRDELSRHDVLHYAGHAESGPRNGGGLRLADGLFTPALLDQLRGRVDVPGLVFLNGCASSDETLRLAADKRTPEGVAGLAGALLLCGARHVIGTLWDVRDEVARLVATSVYASLGQGGTIGAALAAARDAAIAAHGEDSLLWAGHVLYGDPTWRPRSAANAELDDFGVLDGLSDKYRHELLSDDGPTRLLAAAMLLRLGDRSVIPALGRELDTLCGWLSPNAPAQSQRRAALVVQALASAAGLAPAGPPDALPDEAAVRALYARLAEE